VVLQFAVAPDGSPRYFAEVGGQVHPEYAEAVWKAVVACDWIPGRGPDGTPAMIWVILNMQFSG